VTLRETRHHAHAHVTSGALCPFFGRENTAVHSGSLASVCYGDFCCGLLSLLLLLLLLLLLYFLKIVFNNTASICTLFRYRVSNQNFTMASSSSLFFHQPWL
jgi:hypothetical protein